MNIVSLIWERGINLPKVNEEYTKQKINHILNAAKDIALNKPLYEVSMRDIITRSGLSQGGIYRYFSNIDEIYIALINRDCNLLNVEEQINMILDSNDCPEMIISKLLWLWKRLVLDNLVGVGKIYYELCTMYVNDKSRLNKFVFNIKLSSKETYLQEKSISYIISQIENNYFTPKFDITDISHFLVVSLDGIIRDLILSKYYGANETFSLAKGLDENKLMYVTITSLILLLGGNVNNILLEGI